MLRWPFGRRKTESLSQSQEHGPVHSRQTGRSSDEKSLSRIHDLQAALPPAVKTNVTPILSRLGDNQERHERAAFSITLK